MKNASINANNTTVAAAFEEAVSRLVFFREDKKAVEYILMANGMDPKNFFGDAQSVALWAIQRPGYVKFDVWDDNNEETNIVDLENHQACWKDGSTFGAIFTEWEDIPFCEE